jgi:hypothetical protein
VRLISGSRVLKKLSFWSKSLLGVYPVQDPCFGVCRVNWRRNVFSSDSRNQVGRKASFSHSRNGVNGVTFGASMFLMIRFGFRKAGTNCSTEYMLGTNTTYQQRALRTILDNTYSHYQNSYVWSTKGNEGRKEGRKEERKEGKTESNKTARY